LRVYLYFVYFVYREPFVDPTNEEVFNMLTKETPQTFYVGKLVMATVTGFAYKKPQGEELDKAAPLRKGEY
jgi:transcription elongation factor SPT6